MALRLIIEDFEGSTTIVPLEHEPVTIGRKEGNTIQLTEKNVSRSHAKLMLADDGWTIEDLGSYNGVVVNGVVIDERVLLREGDIITIGDYSLVLHDDVSRKTVDLDRPIKAANQAGGAASANSEFKEVATEPPVMAGASSSQDLPRLSPAELDQLSSSGGMAAADADTYGDEEGGGSRRGVIIGIVVVAALVLGVGGYLIASSPGGEAANDAGSAGDDAAGAVASGDSAGQPGDGAAAEAADAGAVADSTGDEDAAVAETGAADASPSDTDEAVIEDDPADADDGSGDAEATDEAVEDQAVEDEAAADAAPAKRRKKKRATSGGDTGGAAPAGADADALLADARKASMSGDLNKAYKLAKQSYAAKKSADALKVMAVSACKMGSKSKAKSAYAKMTSGKDAVKSLCSSHGIQL